MSMPIIPPFAVAASYQNSQYATSPYTTGGSQVFSHLVSPPTAGVAAEVASDTVAHAAGWVANSAHNEVQVVTLNGSPGGGTFFLEWGDDVTGDLAFDATNTTVQTALRGLAGMPGATGAKNAVQSVTLGSATGGTFTLTYGGQTTSALAYNAPANTGGGNVQAALVALSSIGAGNATVTGGAGGPYTVTFTGTLGNSARSLITANAGSLTGTGVNEVQVVTLTSATGGTYKLTYSGQQTGTIAYNASAVTVQAALVALSNIDTADVVVTGADGGPYTVTFQGALAAANLTQMTADGTSLTGGGAAVAVTTQTQGAAAPTPTVVIANVTVGVAPTYNVAVTGNAGGPYTVTFSNLLAGKDVALIHGDGTKLTGGTNPTVTVSTTTAGEGAFVNDALLDTTRQRDGMRSFYDTASGNHF